MVMATRMVWLTLIILFILIVGGILLQIFLSKRKSKWPGLVLPLLTFLYSLLMVLGVAAYDGTFAWGPILAALITGNIPTLVLLAIYWAAREKLRVKDQIDKMNIDDL